MKKLFFALALGAAVSMNAQEESLLNVNLNITIHDQIAEINEALTVNITHTFNLFDDNYVVKLKLMPLTDVDQVAVDFIIEDNTTDKTQIIAQPFLIVIPNKESSVSKGYVQNTYGGETKHIEYEIKLLIS